ncbi:hypothetical protein OPV22_008631 [Ensete ventricosum]|uniref:Uncharacterized protein n=1 Tax=Ensete ventricosum TaxID=4639 RepID=A0AAV8R8U3_ENSVE|nr:hypothetical protein OPV22_008631 [Ensete ventricosum]
MAATCPIQAVRDKRAGHCPGQPDGPRLRRSIARLRELTVETLPGSPLGQISSPLRGAVTQPFPPRPSRGLSSLPQRNPRRCPSPSPFHFPSAATAAGSFGLRPTATDPTPSLDVR